MAGVMLATVFHARVRDSSKAEMTVTSHKGTKEWIRKIGGQLMATTAEEVSETDLDEQGRYVPEKKHT
jgi:hypothetical protein